MVSCIASLLQFEVWNTRKCVQGNTHVYSNHMWPKWLYFDKSILLSKTADYPLLLKIERKKCALNKLKKHYQSSDISQWMSFAENSSDLCNLGNLEIYEYFLSIFGVITPFQHSWFHGVVVEILHKQNWALEEGR